MAFPTDNPFTQCEAPGRYVAGGRCATAGAARSGGRRRLRSGRPGRSGKLRGQLLGARLRRSRVRLSRGGALLGGLARAGERGQRLGVPPGLGKQPVPLGNRRVARLGHSLGQLPGCLHMLSRVPAGLRDRYVGALLGGGYAPVSLSSGLAGLFVRAGLGRLGALGGLLSGLLGGLDRSSGGLVDLGDPRVRRRGGLGDAGIGGLLGRRNLLARGLRGLLGTSLGVSSTRLGGLGPAGRWRREDAQEHGRQIKRQGTSSSGQ